MTAAADDDPMLSCGWTTSRMDAWVAASRAAQGLPRYVEDSTILDNLARLLRMHDASYDQSRDGAA